ncbi:MAG TPA: hypothetical protein VKW76_02465 [Candidatus Binatia bacterium]|nr:hypothetical protein [Candidatus Binatia bacterium]
MSLDGGATFQRPFGPLPFFAATKSAQVMLGADPLTTATRPPEPLCVGGAAIGGGSVVVRARGGGTLVVRGLMPKLPTVPPMPQFFSDGVQLRIVDRSSGAAILDLTATNAIPGFVAGCGGGGQWRRQPEGAWVYRNVSNALPPACKAGSAQGLRKLTLQFLRGGRVRFEGIVQHPVADAPSDVGVTLVFGTSPVVGATGRCATFAAPCVRHRAATRCAGPR